MKAAIFLALFALAWGAVPKMEEKSMDDGDKVFATLEQQQQQMKISEDETLANLEGQQDAKISVDEILANLEGQQDGSDVQEVTEFQESVGAESDEGAQLQGIGYNTCLTRFYILAFTSTVRYGGSDHKHIVELNVRGYSYRHYLYDRKGDDMLFNKGDLWKYNIRGFCRSSCVRMRDIRSVAILAGNNDGWNIDSIVTMVKDARGNSKILTQNLDVNRWVDGNGLASHKRFVLTKA